MGVFQWEPKKLVTLYSPLAHCLNVADAKTCPCTFLLAHRSVNITQIFNSSSIVSWSGDTPLSEKKSPPLHPDNLSMGKSTPSTGGELENFTSA